MRFRLQGAPPKARVTSPPVVKDMVVKNGRLVKQKEATAGASRIATKLRARKYATRAQSRGANQPSARATRLHQVPCATIPVSKLLGATVAPAVVDEDSGQIVGDRRASTEWPVGPNEYIEQITRDIGRGVLDLRGGPWLRPSDPHREAMRVNSLRRTSASKLINAAEVWDLVARPLVFVWAPHLLFP